MSRTSGSHSGWRLGNGSQWTSTGYHSATHPLPANWPYPPAPLRRTIPLPEVGTPMLTPPVTPPGSPNSMVSAHSHLSPASTITLVASSGSSRASVSTVDVRTPPTASRGDSVGYPQSPLHFPGGPVAAVAGESSWGSQDEPLFPSTAGAPPPLPSSSAMTPNELMLLAAARPLPRRRDATESSARAAPNYGYGYVYLPAPSEHVSFAREEEVANLRRVRFDEVDSAGRFVRTPPGSPSSGGVAAHPRRRPRHSPR